MNIFVLHTDPKICAQMHCDKHCVKMILELAQLLSTAHRVLDGEQRIVPQNGRNYKRWILEDDRNDILYKSTHVNHPCAIWVRESSANYAWTVQLLQALCQEYTYRYEKMHAVVTKGIFAALVRNPTNIPITSMTPFALAMPDEYKSEDAVESYRAYVMCEKESFIRDFKKREVPTWLA